MTKKEYITAEIKLNSFNLASGFTILRIVSTFGSVLLSVVCLVLLFMGLLSSTSGNFTMADYENWLYLSMLNPLNFFVMSFYGAFGYSTLVSFSLISSAVYNFVAFIFLALTIILNIHLFKTFRRRKEISAGFGWSIFLAIVNFAMYAYLFYSTGLLVEAGLDGDVASGIFILVLIFWAPFDVLTLIASISAIRSKKYLENHFEKGAALKKRELKQIYENNYTGSRAKEIDDMDMNFNPESNIVTIDAFL